MMSKSQLPADQPWSERTAERAISFLAIVRNINKIKGYICCISLKSIQMVTQHSVPRAIILSRSNRKFGSMKVKDGSACMGQPTMRIFCSMSKQLLQRRKGKSSTVHKRFKTKDVSNSISVSPRVDSSPRCLVCGIMMPVLLPRLVDNMRPRSKCSSLRKTLHARAAHWPLLISARISYSFLSFEWSWGHHVTFCPQLHLRSSLLSSTNADCWNSPD